MGRPLNWCGEGVGQCQPPPWSPTFIIGSLVGPQIWDWIEQHCFWLQQELPGGCQRFPPMLNITGGAPSSTTHLSQLCLHLAGLGVLLPSLPCLAHHWAGPGHLGMWQQPWESRHCGNLLSRVWEGNFTLMCCSVFAQNIQELTIEPGIPAPPPELRLAFQVHLKMWKE